MKQGNPNSLRGTAPFLAAMLLLTAAPAVATEVYTWTDENGVVHYGDAAPQAEGIEFEKITVEEAYRPGTSGAYPVTDPAAPTEGDEDEPAPSFAEQRREEIAGNRDERRQDQAVIEQQCTRHRQRLAEMEPARRVFYTNEAGEQVRMDDDQRMGLIDASKKFLEAYCD
jgi:hypothetical protein